MDDIKTSYCREKGRIANEKYWQKELKKENVNDLNQRPDYGGNARKKCYETYSLKDALKEKYLKSNK